MEQKKNRKTTRSLSGRSAVVHGALLSMVQCERSSLFQLGKILKLIEHVSCSIRCYKVIVAVVFRKQ